jgi:GAF domain-containing protein
VKYGLYSFLGLPLIVKGELLGVISFYTKEEHHFGHAEIEFLSTLAGQAAIAIHNSQLYQQSKEDAAALNDSNNQLIIRTRQQEAVAKLGQRALSETDISSVVNEAASLLVQTLHVEYALVCELNNDGETLLLCAGSGWMPGHLSRLEGSGFAESELACILSSSGPIIFEDLNTASHFGALPLFRYHGVVSGLTVGMRNNQQNLGTWVYTQGILARHSRNRVDSP